MESEEITSFSSESLDDSNYSLNDVFTYLSDQLDKLDYQFRKYRNMDQNNLHSSDDKETLLKYELKYLTCLINLIQSEDPLPWWRFPAHILVDVKNILREDINFMNILFSYCKNRLETDKKDLLELENRLDKIEEMKKKLEEDTTTSLPVESVKSRCNKLDVLFQKDKRRLDDVLDLFPENLKDILQTISAKYFSEDCGNPYISFENNAQFHDLELLLEANIITRHPHDPKQIRLSNFLE